jgi:hypothetical protein
LFIYAKASVVPVCMMLKLLDFGGEWFVAKLTKCLGGHTKQGYWSIIEGVKWL